MDTRDIKHNRGYVERGSWLLVLVGILMQLDNHASFPAYNIMLGFWGVFCSISKHGRATLGLIVFLGITIILDIVFYSLSSGKGSGYNFSLVMTIIGFFLKMHIMYYAGKYFASLGGQFSLGLEDSIVLEGSGYTSLGSAGSVGGGYYPPAESSQNLGDSGELNNSGNFSEPALYK